MKTKVMIKTISAIIFLCALYQAPAAQDLEITGFFDALSSYNKNADDNTDFAMNQAELGLARDISEKASVEVAIAYNPVDAVFELGSAFIDLHLFSNEGGRHRYSPISHTSIQVGQFDVPFGIDYLVYSSIDRKLITPPLAVDLTHEGWNDFGAKVEIVSDFGNAVIYWVNGFESSMEVIDAAQSLTLGVEVGEVINTTPANAFGGRVGINPAENFEIGGSFAIGLNVSDKSEMIMYGGDAQYLIQSFEFKGEYMNHSLNRSLAREDNKGYYFQGLYNFNKQGIFLAGRYGAFQPEGAEWVGRFTGGVGYIVTEGVEIRLETTINKDSDNNTNILQFAAGF